jgi:hypothetical protein
MKKLIPLFVILAFLLSGFVSPPARVVSDVLKTIRLQESQLANVFTFEQLGYAERLMVGPFDTLNLAFSLPANVNLATGSSISLKYAIASSGGSGNSTTAVTSRVGGTLLVYFNDELIDTIVLEGDALQEKEIIIPSAALNIVDNDGRYRLRLFLQADINCRYDDLRTTLIVSKASRFNFQ